MYLDLSIKTIFLLWRVKCYNSENIVPYMHRLHECLYSFHISLFSKSSYNWRIGCLQPSARGRRTFCIVYLPKPLWPHMRIGQRKPIIFPINGSDSSGKLVRVWFIVWHLWLSVITRLFCTHTVLWEETRGDNLSTWFVYWSVFLLDQLLLQLLLLSVRFLVNALHINLSKHVRSNYFCRLKVLSKYRD